MPRELKDPWLTSQQVAELLGWSRASTVRAAVANGYFPKPDDLDADAPANRRRIRWRTSTITKFMAARPGAGARTDLKRAN